MVERSNLIVYSPEEINFVRFCSEQDWKVVCERRRKKCPASPCSDDNVVCTQMVTMMERGEELNDKHKEIIRFWMRDLNWGDRCIPEGGEDPCPNVGQCVERAEACEGLLKKLGIYEPDECRVLETEINKIIRLDLPNIDFGSGGKLSLIRHEVPVPEINGRVDLLLKDENTGLLFVVELKAVRASREDVGQLASYVGWYREHLPEGCKDVKGILLAPEFSNGAEYALKVCAGLLEKRSFVLHVDIIKPVEQE